MVAEQLEQLILEVVLVVETMVQQLQELAVVE
jgi:hypothetical protein